MSIDYLEKFHLTPLVASRAAAYSELFMAHIEPDMVKEIHRTANSGTVLGNERFKDEIERLSGRRVVP